MRYTGGMEAEQQHKEMQEKLDRIFESTEKTRKYILALLIMTVVVFVLPLILMLFVLPSVLQSLTDIYSL